MLRSTAIRVSDMSVLLLAHVPEEEGVELPLLPPLASDAEQEVVQLQADEGVQGGVVKLRGPERAPAPVQNFRTCVTVTVCR